MPQPPDKKPSGKPKGGFFTSDISEESSAVPAPRHEGDTKVLLPDEHASRAFEGGPVMQGKPVAVEDEHKIIEGHFSHADGTSHPFGNVLIKPNPETGENPDGVELLVQLAKSGQIDPWNVDIATVADQYLQAVSELRTSDLKITGKTLLYLAILLRMKSDALAGINYLDPPEEFLDDLLDPDFMDGGKVVQPKLNFRSLDEIIQRRTSTKQPRIRPVTLNDLLKELKRYEELEKRRSLRDKMESVNTRRASMQDYADFTADDIEEMAHEEFIEDTILRLKNILERILIKHEHVSLSELMHEGQIDRISAFLALLFLAARGEFDLHQESFYQELYVRPGIPSPAIPDVEEVLEELVQETQAAPSDEAPEEKELAG